MGELNKKTVKRIFLAMALMLPLQYAFVGILGPVYGEPWPALVLPGLKKIYHSEDLIKLDDVTFIVECETDTGESIQYRIPKDSLFQDIPRSQLVRFIESHLRSEEQVQSLGGEGKNWLENRIGVLYPSKRASKLRIIWKESTYRLGGVQILEVNERLIDEFSISFGEP